MDLFYWPWLSWGWYKECIGGKAETWLFPHGSFQLMTQPALFTVCTKILHQIQFGIKIIIKIRPARLWITTTANDSDSDLKTGRIDPHGLLSSSNIQITLLCQLSTCSFFKIDPSTTPQNIQT